MTDQTTAGEKVDAIAANTQHRVDQVAGSANEAIVSAQRVTHQALDGLARAVSELRQSAAPLLNGAADDLSLLAQRGLNSVRNGSRELRDQARRATQSTETYIQGEPFKSVLIAAATGAALMALIALLAPSRDRR